MKIISHRGYWKKDAEKNSIKAFKRSFELGFGTETDIRDLNGDLVVSHDVPIKSKSVLYFEDVLSLYKKYPDKLSLAINIKSDGLQERLSKIFHQYQIENYFLFDMSVPDLFVSLRSGLKCFARQSEFENTPKIYKSVAGIWMDEFSENWITEEVLSNHIASNREVFIVSPELHGKRYIERWEFYRSLPRAVKEGCTICTDLPEDAEFYFNGNEDVY